MMRQKFNKKKHIIDNYMLDNKAVIKVLVDETGLFYNRYDPKKMTINPDIANYITEKARNIPFKYNLVIEFCSDSISSDEKNKIANMVKDYYSLLICNKDSIIRTNVIKSFFLILLGALIVTYSVIGKKTFGFIYEEVVNVIGWVLLWEGTDILLLSNNDDKVERKNYKQLLDSEIIFSDKLEVKD